MHTLNTKVVIVLDFLLVFIFILLWLFKFQFSFNCLFLFVLELAVVFAAFFWLKPSPPWHQPGRFSQERGVDQPVVCNAPVGEDEVTRVLKDQFSIPPKYH